MRYLSLSFLFLSGCATAATPSPAPSPLPRSITIQGQAPEVLQITESGDIFIRGKLVGHEPQAYSVITSSLSELQQKLSACQAQLSAPKKVEKK